MKREKLKKAGLGLVVILVVIQLIRPERNLSAENVNHIATRYSVPDSVEQLLKTACYDCHSNATVYPWYTNIQPVGWWLQHHVNEGKEKLNFSEFASYRIFRQYHKLEETIELVKENEMPLSSYTWIHKDAVLTEDQKLVLSTWATSVRDSIKATYPADSLLNPRKKK